MEWFPKNSRTAQTMPSHNNNNFSIKRKRGVTNRSRQGATVG